MDPTAKLCADLIAWIVTTVLAATKGTPAPTADEIKATIRAELANRAVDPHWLDQLVDDALARYVKP